MKQITNVIFENKIGFEYLFSVINTLSSKVLKNEIIFLFSSTDPSGNMNHVDIFDETAHLKGGSSVSYLYNDIPDPGMCTQLLTGYPTEENNNQKAVRIKQKSNGGSFIILAQFDYTFYSVSGCTSIFPNTFPFFIYCDPAILEVDQTGSFVWTRNLYHSTGKDFENDLLINQQDILVLGSTAMEPFPGTPTTQQPIISKLDLFGNLISETVYMGTTATRFCPFDLDFDNTGGIFIGGDCNLNSDDYIIANIVPY